MITHTATVPARSLYRVSLITEAGYRVTDVVGAYDEADATKRMRIMMRANHNESYVTIVSVTAA